MGDTAAPDGSNAKYSLFFVKVDKKGWQKKTDDRKDQPQTMVAPEKSHRIYQGDGEQQGWIFDSDAKITTDSYDLYLL